MINGLKEKDCFPPEAVFFLLCFFPTVILLFIIPLLFYRLFLIMKSKYQRKGLQMTKPCRTVLNELRKLSSHTEHTLVLYVGLHRIALENTGKFFDCTKYKDEIFGIIEHLVSAGYLKYITSPNYFCLTHKGLHKYQFEWDSFKSFLFRSILVPVFVSFITTLLTLLVQVLLKLP